MSVIQHVTDEAGWL